MLNTAVAAGGRYKYVGEADAMFDLRQDPLFGLSQGPGANVRKKGISARPSLSGHPLPSAFGDGFS